MVNFQNYGSATITASQEGNINYNAAPEVVLPVVLQDDKVKAFIGTEEYQIHKVNRFPPKDHEIPIADNEAFLLKNPELRERFIERYKKTAKLYYKGQPDFNVLLVEISKWVKKL